MLNFPRFKKQNIEEVYLDTVHKCERSSEYKIRKREHAGQPTRPVVRRHKTEATDTPHAKCGILFFFFFPPLFKVHALASGHELVALL